LSQLTFINGIAAKQTVSYDALGSAAADHLLMKRTFKSGFSGFFPEKILTDWCWQWSGHLCWIP
jgi:hypothetical protein